MRVQSLRLSFVSIHCLYRSHVPVKIDIAYNVVKADVIHRDGLRQIMRQ